MSRRGANLLARDPGVIDAVLRHARQLAASDRIGELLEELRTLTTPADYFYFQIELFREVFEAQEEQAGHARLLKRQRRGKSTTGFTEDPELELLVSDRIVRQLRSVGDALAWRLFNFDRRFLLVLSQNAPVSPMVNKAGLDYELGEVEQTWKQEKCFALLHDLTNTLRIGDLTKFTPEGPRLVEVKKKGSGPTAQQRNRMQRAIDVISGAALPMDEEMRSELWISSVQLKTHLKTLSRAISLADRDGLSSIKVSDQWVVSCLSLASAGLTVSSEEAIGLWDGLKARAFSKARMEHARHHLIGKGVVDRVGRSGASPPLGIYPFDPGICARLICDYLSFETVITWDRLAAGFAQEGFETICPLEEKHESEPLDDGPVLVVTRGEAGLTIRGSGIHQILFEFVDPQVYATAMKELFGMIDRPLSFLFAFSNERAVWR